jgi:hypothetical protein
MKQSTDSEANQTEAETYLGASGTVDDAKPDFERFEM